MPGRRQHTPAHDQVDRHAALAGAIEVPDHAGVGDGVQLEDQPRRAPRSVVLALAIDQRLELAAQRHRRDEQLVVAAPVRVAREVVEDLGDVVDDRRIRREQAEIGVDLRRRAVVVAGADVRVPPDAVGFLADDQAQLAVRLQAHEAVDDVDAGGLHPRRPGDVVAFVEARLQLDEHRDLLALFGRGHEHVDQRRIRSDAVQRHLDRDDLRILDGRAQERLDRRERIERMVDQDVLLAEVVEDLGVAPTRWCAARTARP